MTDTKDIVGEPRQILDPLGQVISLDDLPPSNTTRWVIRRKAIVVAAVRGGLISLDDACLRYALTPEEFLSWEMALENHGVAGLKATRLQYYRNKDQKAVNG